MLSFPWRCALCCHFGRCVCSDGFCEELTVQVREGPSRQTERHRDRCEPCPPLPPASDSVLSPNRWPTRQGTSSLSISTPSAKMSLSSYRPEPMLPNSVRYSWRGWVAWALCPVCKTTWPPSPSSRISDVGVHQGHKHLVLLKSSHPADVGPAQRFRGRGGPPSTEKSWRRTWARVEAVQGHGRREQELRCSFLAAGWEPPFCPLRVRDLKQILLSSLSH